MRAHFPVQSWAKEVTWSPRRAQPKPNAAASPSALLESQKFLALVLRQSDVTGCDGVANNRGRNRAERTLSGARAAPFTCARIRTFFRAVKTGSGARIGKKPVPHKSDFQLSIML